MAACGERTLPTDLAPVLLDFHKATVTNNNLGGRGPGNNDGSHEDIAYADVVRGIKLRVALSSGDYNAYSSKNNGVNAGGFGVVNVLSGTSVRLNFSFHDMETGEAVKLEKFYLSFYSLDHKNANSVEKFSFDKDGVDGLYLVDDAQMEVTKASNGHTIVKSLVGGVDDVDPASPKGLTLNQRKHAFTIQYYKQSSVLVNLALESTDVASHGRDFKFSGMPVTC